MQLPCCPRKQGGLSENILQDIFPNLTPQSVDQVQENVFLNFLLIKVRYFSSIFVTVLPVLAELRESLLGVPQLRVRVPELALREHQLLARLRQLTLGPLELRVRLEEIQPERGEEEQDAFNGLRSLNRFNNAEKMAAPQPS